MVCSSYSNYLCVLYDHCSGMSVSHSKLKKTEMKDKAEVLQCGIFVEFDCIGH